MTVYVCVCVPVWLLSQCPLHATVSTCLGNGWERASGWDKHTHWNWDTHTHTISAAWAMGNDCVLCPCVLTSFSQRHDSVCVCVRVCVSLCGFYPMPPPFHCVNVSWQWLERASGWDKHTRTHTRIPALRHSPSPCLCVYVCQSSGKTSQTTRA